MKREIKFRAWDEQNKIMHNDFQFIKSGEENNDWIIFTSDKQKLSAEQHPLQNPYFQQQFKIMQFTGLLDVNGKEIYEGDVVRRGVIIFSRGKFCGQYYGSGGFYEEWEDDLYQERNIEVLGNIYENPEILEEEF